MTDKIDWDGKGLPPVGCDCEWCGKRGGYFVACKVLAHTDKEIVLQNKEDADFRPGFVEIRTESTTEFRPIIAVDQRRAVLESLCTRIVLNVFGDGGHDRQKAHRKAIDEALEKLTNLPPF